MRSNHWRKSSARGSEPVRRSLAIPASISAAAIVDRYSASVRALNQAAVLGTMGRLPGAKALTLLVSRSQPFTDWVRATEMDRVRFRDPRECSSEDLQSSGAWRHKAAAHLRPAP